MASLIFFTTSSEAWDRKAASLSCVLPVMPAVLAPGASASGVPRSKALAIFIHGPLQCVTFTVGAVKRITPWQYYNRKIASALSARADRGTFDAN